METKEQQTGDQFLSFSLRDEDFAVEIFKVREVLDMATLTRIPRMPKYLCGVINLRGNVVPVTDLGLKLGMEQFRQTVNTCIMIVEIVVEGEAGTLQMGVVTDSVQEVMNLGSGEIEPVPAMGTGLNTEFIRGMGKKGEKFLILLDIDAVLATEGIAVLRDLDEDASVMAGEQEEHYPETAGELA